MRRKDQSLHNTVDNDPVSIRELILEETTHRQQLETNELFIRKQFPKFTIDELQAHPSHQKYSQFRALVRVLLDWNKSIDEGSYEVNLRSLLARNQFIYTSLKNLLTVSHNCFEKTLGRLFEWYCLNSKDKPNVYFQMKKRKIRQDDWIVRDTFKSNTPQQIHNYQRKIFQFAHHSENTNQEVKPVLSKTVMQYWNQYQYQCQEKDMRAYREHQEIDRSKTSYKNIRTRLGQGITKNYYRGQFQNNKKWVSALSSPKNSSHEDIKLQRIQTSLGFRHTFKPFEKENSYQITSIDGSGLLSNPFEKKLGLKKKKN